MSSSSAPLKRLDVTTWTLHDEPPSAVDAAADRRAHGYLLFSEISGWAYLLVLLMFLVPLFTGIATILTLIAATIILLPTAVVAVFRHRDLSRYTGAPVIGELDEVLTPTVQILATR